MLHAGNKNIKLNYRCSQEVKKNIMQTFALRFICFFSNKSSWVKNNYMTSVMITAIFLLKCPFPPKICNETSIASIIRLDRFIDSGAGRNINPLKVNIIPSWKCFLQVNYILQANIILIQIVQNLLVRIKATFSATHNLITNLYYTAYPIYTSMMYNDAEGSTFCLL